MARCRPPPTPAREAVLTVGIDRGVAVSAALSTGELLHASGLTMRLKRRMRVRLAIARRFDVTRVEDLQIANMTRSARGTVTKPGRNVRAKADLNREIMRSGWGLLLRRLTEKAAGRVEKIKPHYTSQRCSACGHVDPESRKSQARFTCTACGFACNADVNAARNIAAGPRGGFRDAGPTNRELQLLASLTGVRRLESRAWGRGRMSSVTC